MQAATRFSDNQRKQLGLLSLATDTDMEHSLETSGERTDQYKVLASKMFNCDYTAVTDQMRKAAKRGSFMGMYS